LTQRCRSHPAARRFGFSESILHRGWRLHLSWCGDMISFLFRRRATDLLHALGKEALVGEREQVWLSPLAARFARRAWSMDERHHGSDGGVICWEPKASGSFASGMEARRAETACGLGLGQPGLRVYAGTSPICGF
jgi:hypothetical protein